MKKFYVIVLFLLVAELVSAQPKAIYSHDVSGNRIKRMYDPPLPVTLISFTAEESETDGPPPSAFLRWRTASETNSDHFDIQRSGDGKKWFVIAAVLASGDKASDTDYSFIDRNPLDGQNFYRLKMVDRDSTFAYSRIRSLDFRSQIVFYPNPIKGKLIIKGILASEGHTSKVRIWDATGRLQKQLTGFPVEGIDMTELPTGIYTVSITQKNGTVTTRKVVKD